MKLIHLSDLHIGKRVNEVSMIDDQAYILEQIIRIIDEEQPQAVLIAGDVYDKSVPSAEAVTLLDDFLYSLTKRKLTVFIISGNHDSPERLAFGSRLMTGAGIHVSPVYDGTVSPISLTDDHGIVNFYLLPFIKPAHVRHFHADAAIESYTDACRVAVAQMQIDPGVRNVLLTHQFVTGASRCESEDISVGGTDNVDASVFDLFDYVALGHIHGPQNIGSPRIRYCGTPLKYSFSEADHCKSVTVVELEEKGSLTVRTAALTPRRDMRRIRGTYGALTDKRSYEGTSLEDYLHITLTDEEDVPEAMGRLRCIYPNIMKLSYDNARTRSSQAIGSVEDIQRKSPLDLFRELYELQNNQPMSSVQEAYIQDLIESIWEDAL
ncbi:MAG: exonuclease SbcCD subunit D [Oscillospiraceae bacterium]|nr:exonuclease SbcCD subunit D [Oscillospiraceae bacterium]